MNFTFSDISSVYLKMMKKEMSGGSAADIKAVDVDSETNQTPVFGEKLSKTMEKVSAPEEKIDQILASLSETLEEDSGTEFAIALKALFLMLSNGDLKNIKLDDQGLDALKKILVAAGFQEDEINQLITELIEGSEGEDFPLDAFFDRLSELTAETASEDNAEPETFIDTSYLPVLESILLSLGIDTDKVQEILSSADKGDQGISLDVVIQELKTVRKTAFYNNTPYQTKENDTMIGQVLQQLGVVSEDSEVTSFSLDELIASLEKLKKAKFDPQQVQPLENTAAKSIDQNEVLDNLNTLFKGLEIKKESIQKSLFQFSEFQIKEPLKAGFVALTGEALTETVKPETGSSLKEMFREMSALFEKEKQIHSNGTRVTEKETVSLLKQLKTGSMKTQDGLQTAVSDLKTTDTQTTVSSLKSASAPKQLPDYVTQQVGRSIVRAVNQGESTLRIQLKPPELGRMMMTIDNSGNTLKVSILTESLAAKEILTSNTTELKSLLSNSGVNLERFEVDMSSDFRQSMADAKNQAGNFSRRRKNANSQETNGNKLDNAEEITQLPGVLNPDGSLHYVA